MEPVGDEHREACTENMKMLHSHLEMLERSVQRDKVVNLWMSVNEPLCGCTFWSDKPEPTFYDDKYVLFASKTGVMVAGELLYSMPILFPKIALLSAGRVKVQIADISDDTGSPAYVIRRLTDESS